ncbi:trypsin-like peptidase domain-containing protein, partial [Streptomyces boncukensis]|nr:serine protease [Streptomyces boncukensis]
MSAERGQPALVRICDLAGRARGSGFPADGLGTVITSHEAVDGLTRAVVHAPGDRTFLAEHGDITPLPEWDLALIRTTGLGLAPLVIGAERPCDTGTRVVFDADGRLEAALTGTVAATYTSTERYHPLEQVLELALPEATCVQLRLSRRASGAPVRDATTGAVLGVLGTALHAPGRTACFAVPLYAAGVLAPAGPLGVLLRRNGATVPGFGPDLNLAGTLQLTATSVGPAVERCAHAVARPEIAEEFAAFTESGATVVGLVGDPGTGRTTELAAFAARRARGAAPEPTVWLRGADLRAGDGSVREAVARALSGAARIIRASRAPGSGPRAGEPCAANPDVAARLARDAKRPFLVLLDAPEEMPPQLAHGLRQWTVGTSSWLRASGARMAVACRPEYWEQAGALFPPDLLYAPRKTGT